MWRRISAHLHQSPWRSAQQQQQNLRRIHQQQRLISSVSSTSSSSTTTVPPFQKTTPLFSQHSDTILSKGKTVEDVMPIATGHEREEIEAALQGKNLLEMDYPEGPFGTKDAPAIVKSTYDKRIVGCPGGEGEDEHDVVWFWLEKGKPHECSVCTQYFELQVVGPGGSPDGHGDDDHH
ncbi:cytochrome c oxidase subunit 5b-2, mitochondrial-like [Papaver somniferum]|uniref:cytochrome c oxidase subunit 5b-2, mitochondrial-like n=1 Tax=Papaver somniferum TaxID=3469 RepID=UPI000E6F5B2E|nr:cytochrome c oxidase subunit 5b-2, mitochondrial-like [Papaver somniferum]